MALTMSRVLVGYRDLRPPPLSRRAHAKTGAAPYEALVGLGELLAARGVEQDLVELQVELRVLLHVLRLGGRAHRVEHGAQRSMASGSMASTRAAAG